MNKNVVKFCKQTRFIFYLLILCCGVVALSGCKQKQKKISSELSEEVMDKYPNFAISDSILMKTKAVADFDLGKLSSGETIEKILIIKNTSSQSFLIEHIKVDCGCIKVNFPKEPILSGQRKSLTLTFNSRGQHGWLNKTVELKTSLNEKPFKLNVKCDIDN